MLLPTLLLLLRATFTVGCAGLKCTVDASASGPAVASYRWQWGDGRLESHNYPVTTNTWQAGGTYIIKLIVTDSNGVSSLVTQRTVRLPATNVVVHDTVTVHDTVAVHDTVTKHDTITVGSGLPLLPPGVIIDNAAVPGENNVYWNGQYLGRLVIDPSRGIAAVRYTIGDMKMVVQGYYPTQIEAIAALMKPLTP